MTWVNGRRTVRCRNCWLTGHNVRNCPTLTPEAKARYTAGGDRARKCSYCGESGHTRPRCALRKSDMAQYAVRNGEYRREVLDHMVSLGLGIGSLVYSGATQSHENIAPSSLYMIQSIDWDDVQGKQTHNYVLRGARLRGDDYNTFVIPSADKSSWYNINVLTRRPESEIRDSVPSNWLTGTSGIERFFNKKRR